MWSRARRLAVGSVLFVVLAACVVAGETPSPDHPRAEPWADRPVVDLAFVMAPDLSSASGVEPVVFTPDLDMCEVVFRAWPNKPTAAEDGTSLVVRDDRRSTAVRPSRC